MRRVGELLPGLLRHLRLEEPAAGWRAVAAWPEVVGERLARRTRALRWNERKLWIEVEGSVWMHELSCLKRSLIAKINRHLGEECVSDLVFVPPGGGTRR